MDYAVWHGVIDVEKLNGLIGSMIGSGWVGSPLVADGDQLLTGSHRYVAAEIAGVDVPVVDIREIVADWDALIEETGYGYEVAVAHVCTYSIGAAIKSDNGLDIH